jgi:hypothetical protein
MPKLSPQEVWATKGFVSRVSRKGQDAIVDQINARLATRALALMAEELKATQTEPLAVAQAVAQAA